jgi:repressor LexA
MLASGSDMDDVTPRQRRILDYIRRTIHDRGYPPTVREIGEAVGLTSSSSVHAQLTNLQKKGLLRKDADKPRAIEIAGTRPRGSGAVTVPVLGRVAAGAPILADEHVEEYIAVPASLASEEEHFALRVVGDSMIEAGIFEQDLVVIRRQDVAEDGSIVAALIPGPAEEEATIKRLRRRGSRITLVPENSTMEPFDLPSGGRILGQVVAVLRKL